MGSAQEQWLRADLAANTAACTLAYLHHPRFTSGSAGNNPSVQPLWQALYDARADVILASHAHGYERFARQTPTGTLNTTRGIRQFIVGTGGDSLERFTSFQSHTQTRNSSTYGVLELRLGAADYGWRFVPVTGGAYTDSGSAPCH